MTSKFYTCVTTGLELEPTRLWNLLMPSDQTCVYAGNKELHREPDMDWNEDHENCVKSQTVWPKTGSHYSRISVGHGKRRRK